MRGVLGAGTRAGKVLGLFYPQGRGGSSRVGAEEGRVERGGDSHFPHLAIRRMVPASYDREIHRVTRAAGKLSGGDELNTLFYPAWCLAASTNELRLRVTSVSA